MLRAFVVAWVGTRGVRASRCVLAVDYVEGEHRAEAELYETNRIKSVV
jgi:hypothetical protein